MRTCIVTGGAGFIGSALSAGLLERFDRVIALDTMNPQIHPGGVRPRELADGVELIRGSVCDPDQWKALLATIRGDFSVVHLAAETGTAQSLGEATLHTYTNVVGTSTMLDAFTQTGKYPEQVFLTSSRAVYGEGAWMDAAGQLVYPGQRSDAQLSRHEWDFPGMTHQPMCAQKVKPTPTSVYGATKLCQENLISVWCQAMRVPYKMVRLQNVYGPGQSLINSYTGIVSLFVRQAKHGETIQLYEDGGIIRDFVYITDVAQAILLDLDSDRGIGRTLDIGTGKQTTIGDVGRIIAAHYHAPEPVVCEKYRNGDVRHAYCDPQPALEAIGYQAEMGVEEGILRLCDWIDDNLDEWMKQAASQKGGV